ncbi:MAG: type II and III secretion system protein family protein [Bdellovibrionales bacterium]
MTALLKHMTPIRLLFTVLGSLLVLVFSVASVFAAKGHSVAGVSSAAPLGITLGKADLIDVSGPVADVLVANSDIIDVMAVQANRLYIVGLAVGDTNIIALDERGNIVKRLDVHVSYDLQAIQALLGELFPSEDVQVRSVHDQILLTGAASNPDVASKIANVVGHYVSDLMDDSGDIDGLISNLLEVRGEQQVMLQVKIIEASRDVLRELGVETGVNDPNELATTTIFGQTPSSNLNAFTDSAAIASAVALSQDPIGAARIIGDTGLRGIGQIGLFFEALEDENLANILAEPNLTAVSGQQAGFLAGGEFPVPVGRDNVGNVVVEFREFGVSLNFKPVVLASDRISLQMNTEVSSLDFDSAIILADLTVPGLDVRRAETTVEIGSGNSLMIAGLLQSEAIKGMTGLPGVSKAPILGDLISSDSFRRNETELIVIVTPYLVQPYADQEVAEKVPEKRSYPLAHAFAANLRRSYAADDDLIGADDGRYGYLLD